MIWFYDAIASIRDFIELGGDVLYAIMLVLFLMWTFILERLWYFYRVHPGEMKQTIEAWDARADTTSWYAKRVREQMISETNVALKKNIGLIKALIAICPLLGLMGTVTGMVSVFDVMTYSGSGNARACRGQAFVVCESKRGQDVGRHPRAACVCRDSLLPVECLRSRQMC